jgi:hypothetical protein
VTPNPQHLECLVKTPDDLHALRYLLPPIKVDADRMRAERKRLAIAAWFPFRSAALSIIRQVLPGNSKN